MTIFKISAENNISLLDSTHQAGENSGETFSTLQELGALAEKWPGSRLIEIWNSLPGVEPVQRFTSRQVATTRIWNAIQHLQTSGRAGKQAPAAKKVHTNKATRAVRSTAGGNTKAARVIALMRKPKGVTLHALMRATGGRRTAYAVSSVATNAIACSVRSVAKAHAQRCRTKQRGTHP